MNNEPQTQRTIERNEEIVVVHRERESEPDRNHDVFLYSADNANGVDSCNVICLFLLFISLFFIMLITSDNSTNTPEYEASKESELMNERSGDKEMNDFIDNMLIQSLHFKGYYKLYETNNINNIINTLHGKKKKEEKETQEESKKRKESSSYPLKDSSSLKTGIYEAKLITLKLALTNVTKSFIFFHFDPPKGYSKKIKKKNKKYQFLGISGLNINKSNNYVFTGLGYNISNYCQSYHESCLCNYNINIKQNISNYDSTSLRDLEESYLYVLKNYLIDESDYFKNYIMNQYYDEHQSHLNSLMTRYEKGMHEKTHINNPHFNMGGNNKRSFLSLVNDSVKSKGKDGMIADLTKDTNNNNNNKNNDHQTDLNNSDMTNSENIINKTDEPLNEDYQGYITSHNCNFYVSISGNDIDKNIMGRKVTQFSLLFNVKSIFELLLFWKQIGKSENMHNASKISIISICLNSFIEVFESLLLLYEVMLSRLLLMHFIVMVMFKFLLFTLMEVRYVLIIWKAHHQHEITQGWEVMQRKLSKLYKYYYGSILLVILIFYYIFPYYPYILLILYFCWVPQILLDIWKGQRKSFHLKFVILLSLCRLLLPIYMFLYPDNIFQQDVFTQLVDTSNVTFSIMLIVIMIIQVIIMSIQRMYGPRYFINLDLLPYVHNYYKTIDVNFETGIPECVICMYDILLKDKKYCVTPCYHIFHEKCLQQWMNIKLECPTCRGILPNFP